MLTESNSKGNSPTVKGFKSARAWSLYTLVIKSKLLLFSKMVVLHLAALLALLSVLPVQ